MPLAAPFEVLDCFVTQTKGCCWQKFSESKLWDYLPVPRTALAECPKGPQSVHSSCFLIFSIFSPFVVSYFFSFYFDCKSLMWEILSPRLSVKHLFTTVLLGGRQKHGLFLNRGEPFLKATLCFRIAKPWPWSWANRPGLCLKATAFGLSLPEALSELNWAHFAQELSELSWLCNVTIK